MPPSTRRDGLLRKHLEQFTKMLHALEKGDVRALHRTRVETRRLRELLPVLQLEGRIADKLSRRLRKVTEHLGSVRELDVLALLINELRESGRYPADALIRVGADVDKDLKVRRKKLVSKAPIDALHRLARKLDAVAAQLESSEPEPAGRSSDARTRKAERGSRWAADARVSRRAAGLDDAIATAGAMYLPERLHDVRIVVKKLRYATEVASEAGGSVAKGDLRALKRAQDVLGRLHDLQVLVDRARQVQASLTPPNVVTWRSLEAMVEMLEADCRRLHGRYMRERDLLIDLGSRLAGRPRAAKRVTA